MTKPTPKQRVNWLSVIVFYVIACAISWPFFWWRDMHNESWLQWDVPKFVRTWSYMWGPGIAALFCFVLFRNTHFKTITLFGTSIFMSVLFYLAPIAGLAIVGINNPEMNAHLFPLVLGGLGFISILGEELGWRGFLQDAVRPLPQIARYLLIGTMWELWHFTNRMGEGELLQILVRVGIWIAALTFVSFLMGRATDRSKSLVVAVTLHAWIDILAEYWGTGTLVVFGLSIPFWIYMLSKWEADADRRTVGA
jgi:uncharacterized protein